MQPIFVVCVTLTYLRLKTGFEKNIDIVSVWKLESILLICLSERVNFEKQEQTENKGKS